MSLTWTTFSGIRPKVNRRLLPTGNAQVADNVNTERGGLRPLEGTSLVKALAKANVKTIYRFGQALESSTDYWFHWDKDVDVVKGAIADDTDERTYWTGDGIPKYTTASLGTAGTNLPSSSRPLGVSPPATAPTLTASGDPLENAGQETRVIIYTFVTDMGEESAPSSPATIDITVGQGVALSNLATTAANGAVVDKKRIYQAQRGSYLFVAEIPGADTTYTITLSSDSLGENCPSIDWDTPPDSMFGLTAGQNGIIGALDGYNVLFCDPYHPYAWPPGYSQAVDYPTVGLGQYGQTFVVLTTGLPYLIDGVHPSSFTVTPAKFYQPCVAKRSIVSTGSDVIWASPDGLVSLGNSGPLVLTEGIFTPADWRALNPETIIGAWHEGCYVGCYGTGDDIHGFMFSPSKQEWIPLPDLRATAMYRDTVGDALYVCVDDTVHKFRGGDLLSYTWKSQEVVTPLMDYGVARVTGSYPVQFELFKNGVSAFSKMVQSDEPFKLPSGLARTWEIQLSGYNDVQGVVLSTSEETA